MNKDIFRKTKGTLTPEQMSRVNFIKDEAENFKSAIQSDHDLHQKDKLNIDQRCIDKAIEKLEECVMWAVKGYTNTNKN
jgi:hypothetical protein